jgi:hypothetical protein
MLKPPSCKHLSRYDVFKQYCGLLLSTGLKHSDSKAFSTYHWFSNNCFRFTDKIQTGLGLSTIGGQLSLVINVGQSIFVITTLFN